MKLYIKLSSVGKNYEIFLKINQNLNFLTIFFSADESNLRGFLERYSLTQTNKSYNKHDGSKKSRYG